MKPRSLSTLMLAAALALPALSMAQGHDDQHDDHADNGHAQQPANKPGGNPPGRQAAPLAEKHPPKPVAAHVERDARGAGPDRAFHRGDKLSGQYRDRQYVVDDWRSHHLKAPPRGYHWVQTGNDYVLAAIATGIIAEVLFNQ